MIAVIFCGIVAGLLVGLLPGVGHTVLLISIFPLLLMLPPELILMFYIVSIQASEFSGSVSALSFGLLGEITSQPALEERRNIMSYQALDSALRVTAMASVIGCAAVLIPLPYLLEWFRTLPVMMRTETMTLFSVLVVVLVVFWKENTIPKNTVLLLSGIFMSQIGFHNAGSGEYHFFTFDQPWLYDGVPMIAVVTGFIAMHAWYKFKSVPISHTDTTATWVPCHGFSFTSACRGAMIGSVAGMIPMIGAALSSTIAHTAEKIWHPGPELSASLARLTAAESANNSSHIAVLIPLLVLGVAIIPSEMFLTSVLYIKNWTPDALDTWNLAGLGFYGWISLGLAISAVVSYIFCYSLVAPMSRCLRQRLNLLNTMTFAVMTITVIYAGTQVANPLFFLLCFAVFSFISWWHRADSFIPLVAGFLLGDSIIENSQILWSLYL